MKVRKPRTHEQDLATLRRKLHRTAKPYIVASIALAALRRAGHARCSGSLLAHAWDDLAIDAGRLLPHVIRHRRRTRHDPQNPAGNTPRPEASAR